jgi:hypothetical protein
VAFGGRDVSIEHLVDALWSEAKGDTARASVDTTILRLRRLLGDATALILDGGARRRQVGGDERHRTRGCPASADVS